MAGSGVALRLHEFKERNVIGQQRGAVLRPGRDIKGLYPGQLARAHVIPSPWQRMNLQCVKCPPEEEQPYQRSFDLLTLKALELRAAHTPHTHPTSHTVYQQEFGRQAHLYPPDDNKMTLISHPAPLQQNYHVTPH
ncbi:uncharacterized protein C1orf100 homolog [Pangasianodon hypophthalmus]|uniref:uncharacterized protein C1orf100 homolog n=1 Tax=Pangasianodon hypophthalmus TaxID=310915 RepID=UPI00147D82D2|nr:uncharacterized protein C1orf100 homolog [Pangasianodon hypophthalmus]